MIGKAHGATACKDRLDHEAFVDLEAQSISPTGTLSAQAFSPGILRGTQGNGGD